MTEQITLMRLWDSPQMKSYTTMQNIKSFAMDSHSQNHHSDQYGKEQEQTHKATVAAS